jgi:hypothetical protein
MSAIAGWKVEEWVGRTKRSHLGNKPSAWGIQDDNANAIGPIGAVERVYRCIGGFAVLRAWP